MNMQKSWAHCASLAAGAALLLFAAAPANARTTIFFNNYTDGLGAQESVSGEFAVKNGLMGHVNNQYYSNNSYSYYQISNLDLTNFTYAQLEFDFDLYSEANYDAFNVLASTDSTFTTNELLQPIGTGFYGNLHSNFANIGKVGASGVKKGTVLFDLTPYLGGTLNLRLQFASDHAVYGTGMKMDNMWVTGDAISAGAVPEPATWATMIIGFGMAGSILRRRRTTVAAAAA